MFTESKILEGLILTENEKKKERVQKLVGEFMELANKIAERQNKASSFYLVGSSETIKQLEIL